MTGSYTQQPQKFWLAGRWHSKQPGHWPQGDLKWHLTGWRRRRRSRPILNYYECNINTSQRLGVCGRKKKDIIDLLLATSYSPYQIWCPAFSILLECVYNSLCRKPDESRDLFLFICSILFVTRYYGPLIPLSTMGKRPAYAVSLHLFPRLGRFRIDGHQRQFPPNDASRKGTHTHTIKRKRSREPNGHRKVGIWWRISSALCERPLFSPLPSVPIQQQLHYSCNISTVVRMYMYDQ
jgi:hypothetical protein